jgi:DNA polymerase-3 subunit beta
MFISVSKEMLVQGVNHVAKAVSPKTVIPILSGIKFEADEKGLTLTASDADISISYRIPRNEDDVENVIIHQTGKIVLPAKYIVDMVKKLPSDTVNIKVMDHYLTSITSGPTEFNLHGMDGDEYPKLPQIEEESSFYVSSRLLKNLIRQVSFAASTSESRPILTGIQWNLSGDELEFVGTDSHRLAKGKIKIENGIEGMEHSIVVPGKSLNELNKILDDEDEHVEIVISGNQILIRTANLVFYSRLLEGKYPDTKRIIPPNSKTLVKVDVKLLHDALERASLIASRDRNNVVKVSTISDHELEIYSFFPEIGKLSETIQVSALEGEELKISFNAKYMLDALKVIDSTEVEINFTGAMSPFVIRPIGQDGTLHLIVPVRTY